VRLCDYVTNYTASSNHSRLKSHDEREALGWPVGLQLLAALAARDSRK